MSENAFTSWQFWAFLSAIFAALTAIFAKIGIENVNSDFATFIRTVVILLCLGAFLTATDQFQSPGSISGRTYLFLVLSGLAIWKPVQFSELLTLFYDFQTGRLVHFLGMSAIVLFLLVHVALALLVPRSLLAMLQGGPVVQHTATPAESNR